jgi:hypothetical protein
MTTNLAESIRVAHANNEARIAAEVGTPKSEFDAEAQSHIQQFAEFCKGHGVPGLPAAPATCAMFVPVEHARGESNNRILAALAAIEAIHSNNNLANPIATTAVRTELGRILNLDAPRSWPKADRPLFNALPIEVRAVLERRAEQDSKALRQLQNQAAELRKHQRKEIDNGTSDQKAD